MTDIRIIHCIPIVFAAKVLSLENLICVYLDQAYVPLRGLSLKNVNTNRNNYPCLINKETVESQFYTITRKTECLCKTSLVLVCSHKFA